MTTMNYYHRVDVFYIGQVKLIPYAERQVLVVRVDDGEGEATIIPGFVVEGRYKVSHQGSVPVTTVELITNPTQRKELSDILRQQKVREPFNFW